MAYLGLSRQFLDEVAYGNVSGWSMVRKFGYNSSVGTTIVPITQSGVYQTPTALTSLEILSSSANDASAGTGARTIYIEGIGTSYALTSETVTLNGTTAVALVNQYYRVYRAYIVTSGTYATQSSSSHAGTLTIRTSGGGATWCTIGVDSGLGLGQSLTGSYTVPHGYTAHVYASYVSVESTKTVTSYFFARQGIDTIVAPFTAMRLQTVLNSAAGFTDFGDTHFIGEYPAKTDIGFMAKTPSGTAAVSVEFKIYLQAV